MTEPTRTPGRIVRLITRLHDWAESGWAGPAVGSWAVLQGSLVLGPADTLLAPLGLADPPRVWRLAAWAIVGSIAGGLLAFYIGVHAFEEIGRPLLALIGVGPEELARSRTLFEEHGWQFVAVSTVTPISTKFVCIAAGAFGVPPVPFALALVGGRTLRFLVVAAILRFAGERILARVERMIGRPLDAARR